MKFGSFASLAAPAPDLLTTDECATYTGFKSYLKPVILGPFSAFTTAIVGPNGAGKSVVVSVFAL